MSIAKHHRVLQHLHARGDLGLTQRDVDQTGALRGISLPHAVGQLRKEGVTITTEREHPPDGGHARARYVLDDIPPEYAPRFALDDDPPEPPPIYPPNRDVRSDAARTLYTYLTATLLASGGSATIYPQHTRPARLTAHYDPASGALTLAVQEEGANP